MTAPSWLQFNPSTTDAFTSTAPPDNVSVAASPPGSPVETAVANIYFYLTGVTSVLSMVGCVCLVATFAAFRELHTTGRLLLVCLSAADFLTALGNLVGIVWYVRKDGMEASAARAVCQFHASLTIFSSIGSFFWSTCVGIHLYVCICLRNAKMADRIFWPFFVVCWTPAAVIAIVSWSLDVLGHDPAVKGPSWCWIKPNVEVVSTLFWQYVTGKCWEMTCYLVTAVTYALIKRRLIHKKKVGRVKTEGAANDVRGAKRPNTSLIAETNRKLVFVPLIFVALRIWGTIRFLIGAHSPNADGVKFALAFIVPLQGVGDSAQGFANFLLFLLLYEEGSSPLPKHPSV